MRSPRQGRRPARAVVVTLIIVTIGAAACGTPDTTSAGGEATTTTAPANAFAGTSSAMPEKTNSPRRSAASGRNR